MSSPPKQTTLFKKSNQDTFLNLFLSHPLNVCLSYIRQSPTHYTFSKVLNSQLNLYWLLKFHFSVCGCTRVEVREQLVGVTTCVLKLASLLLRAANVAMVLSGLTEGLCLHSSKCLQFWQRDFYIQRCHVSLGRALTSSFNVILTVMSSL